MQRTIGKYVRVCSFLFVIACFAPGRAWSQNANSGEFKGSVMDSSGAVIPEVAVSILNVDTGVKTPTTTNSSGIYDVPSVPPGRYSITFSKGGFRDLVRSGIVLQVQTLEINATLQVGATSEVVEVNAASPLVETQTSEQHVTFDTKSIQDAPTVGGVWMSSLTQLVPGMNNGGGQYPAGQSVGVNGTQGQESNFLLDGAGATDPRDNNPSDNYPPIDAISEVNVNTSNFGAQYGNGLATFNVILKSGTNQWHGSAFEFIQNDAFNARNFFDTSGKKAPERWNQYGGSVGGPIKKDKLFFFFTYQRNPSTTSSTQTYSYPTAAMRSGNFSAPGFPTIYDPTTGQAFLNNQIPANRIDPVAAKLQSYWPNPNAAGCTSNCSAFNNYTANVSAPALSTWYVGKIDYDVSANNRLSGSITEYPVHVIYNNDPLCPNGGSQCTPSHPNLNQDGQITDTWTINPTMVNEARIGAMRELDEYRPPDYGKNFPTTVGLEPTYGSNAPGNIFPMITIDGNGNGSMNLYPGADAVLAEGLYTASDVVTLVRGRHTVKFGGEFDRNYQNYTNWGDVSSGNFEFTGIATGTGGKPGIAYADFLLGEVYDWHVQEYDATSEHMWNLGTFLQDDFKVTPHLTLNLGLRWQIQSGWSVKHDEFGVFDPTLANPGPFPNCSATCTAGMPGAILYGGKNGRDQIQGNVYREFSPRVGVAWSPKDRWSIRASYGIFDAARPAEQYSDGALGLGFDPNSPYLGYASSSCQLTNSCAAFKLQTGPPPNSVTFPTLQTLSPALNNGSFVDYYPVNMPVTYTQEVMVDIQHELPGGFLVDAGYVFTKGTNLNFQRDTDQIDVASGATTQPFPQYKAVQAHLFDGYSNYNALQLRGEKRFSHGLSFLVLYAHSKELDTGTSGGNQEGLGNGDVWQNAYNIRANYGIGKLDSPNTTSGQITYEVPFGAGRTFAAHGLLNEVFGGWRATALFQLHSGVPFTPVMASDLSGTQTNGCCGFAWYPNLIGTPAVSNQSIAEWFNPAAYAAPASGTLGNVGRDTLRAPAYRDVDLSLGKAFTLPFRESRLEIRGDMYDAFNHPLFAQPGNSISASGNPAANGAGQITSANSFGPGRIIQMGARITF